MEPPPAPAAAAARLPGLLLALLLCRAAAAAAAGPPSCPRPCACPQPLEVHCTFRSLFAIPAAVPKHVRRMNLGFNSIGQITDDSLAGLTKLELLLLHGNDLHHLPDGAFRDLGSLQMLKISYNKLKEVSRNALRGLWALTRLHLDHNRLELLDPDAFQGLTSLRLLQLEGNRLRQLHPDTFATFSLLGHFHLSTLKHLYLSDNELTALPAGLAAALPQLENLYLHGNPWTCDCNLSWLQDWDRKAPGVLKCKKDKALPGGQACPVCASPRAVREEELLTARSLECSGPVISSPRGTSSPDDAESEQLTAEDFADPFGNVSLGLSDEHGNQVDLECSVREPRASSNVSWEQSGELELSANVSLSVDLECLVDRGRYEQLWRLIAYYSSVPAHLRRGTRLREEPRPSYSYRQDSEKDAQYYTGVKVDVAARPSWLMQRSAGLRLDRLRSSAKTVYLVLSTDLAETAHVELLRSQPRTWVSIESTDRTRRALSAVLGAPSHMDCHVSSSGAAAVRWRLPDGTTVGAPYSSADGRVSVSAEGRLTFGAVRHADAGIYYCVAKVEGDLAVLPLHLSVQESSGPPPGGEEPAAAVEGSVGSPISLPCVTSGSPDAEVQWILPSSDTVGLRANTSRQFVFPNGTLHIPETQAADGGYYKCVAINQHGVDTAVTRVALVRPKVLVRPLRKFPKRPQSAAGVNTQIKVPTEDPEEGSGESEVPRVTPGPRRPSEPVRRRIPSGSAAGRRGLHPSKRTWRRPMLRRPTGPQLEDRRVVVESRRKINSSKTKIDPEKWADILAKIRDRKTQSTAAPLPAQRATEVPVVEPATHSEDPVEGSTEGLSPLEEAREEPGTTAQTLTTRTQTSSDQQDPRAQESATPTARHKPSTHGTGAPQTVAHEESITVDPDLDVRTTSNGGLFLPQTTSVSTSAVTLWQANANTGGVLFPLVENRREEADPVGGAGADRAEGDGRSVSEDADDPSDGSETPRPVGSNGRETNSEESQTDPEATTPEPSQPQTSPALSEGPWPTGGRSRPRLRGPNGRRKNGGRRKRPNGRKQKPNKAARFPASTPALSLAWTERTATHSATWESGPSGTAEASFTTAVPFSSSQAVSSDPLSHEGSTASPFSAGAAAEVSAAARPQETDEAVLPLERPRFESTTAAPAAHSTVFVVTDRVMVTSPAATGTFEAPFPPGGEAGGPPTPGLSQEADRAGEDDGPLESPDGSSGDFEPATQTPAEAQPEALTLDTQTQKGESSLVKERDPHFPASLPSPTAGVLPFDTESTPEGPLAVPSSPSEVDEEGTWAPEEADHRTTQGHIPRSESEGLEAATASLGEDPPTAATTPAVPGTPTTGATHAVATTPAGTEAPWSLSAAPVPDGGSQIQQTSAPQRTSDPPRDIQTTNHNLHPTSAAAELIISGRETGQQVATTVPTVSAVRPTSTLSTYERHQEQPRRGSAPGRKPRITKSNFQTYAARAEADVRLPCEAEGEPVPFLSWTRVASGASVARNTRVQRFEVDSNGTLIIRNAHPADGGQYLCTAQSPSGVDRMLVNLVVQSQRPRVLQPRQREVSVPEGGRVQFDCVVEGHPVPLVTWVLPNHTHVTAKRLGAPPRQRISVLTNGTLRIGEAAHADRGVYKCIGSSTAGADAVSVRLQVSTSPPWIQQGRVENATFPEGGTARIHCTATGSPRPVIRWITPDGVQHAPSPSPTGHNVYVLSNGTLLIRGLGPGSSGRYECLASNAVATSRRTVFVSVDRSPSSTRAKITRSSPPRTDVVYGDTLLLDCVARGEPEPWILWRTPSKKLVDSQYSFDSRIKVSPNGTITIGSVTDKDAGDYLCAARNKMGDDYVLLRVNVLTRPAKIKHDRQLSRQEVAYGGDLKVDCVASGLPNPEISWALPDGTMVNPDKQHDGFGGLGRSRRYVVFDNGTLYFNHVGMPEEGDYTCYAENKLGKDQMKVRVKVKVATSPPSIQDKNPKVLRVLQGETVALRCSARGEAAPVITWLTPANRVITPTLEKYQILDDGTLVVLKVQRVDAGNYTCLAQNSAGRDQKVIRLEVGVAPPVIKGLSGTLSFMKVRAVQEQRVLMDCVAEGTPTPSVTWLLPGSVTLPVPYFSNTMTVHQNGTLEIRSVQRTDSGQFSCIARNEGGEVRLLVNLEVREAGERSQVRAPPKLESLELTVGKAMTLNCSFEGSALPHVTWILPGGSPLRSGARFSKFYHRPDGSLVISNPSLAEAGTYRCVGRVPQGTVERTVTLSPGRKPEISSRYPAPVSIRIGESLPLHCKTAGDPVRLTWTLPSGVVLNRPQRAGRYAVLANGTLSIQQVSIYDRGSYLCRVSNEYGSALLPVSVSVAAYPPQITSGPPSVTFAKRGVAIQLNCAASGTPRADVAWETPDKTRLLVGSQPRLYGNRYLHPQGSLIIQHPTQRDAGVYRCTARNAVGVDSRATFLNVF